MRAAQRCVLVFFAGLSLCGGFSRKRSSGICRSYCLLIFFVEFYEASVVRENQSTFSDIFPAFSEGANLHDAFHMKINVFENKGGFFRPSRAWSFT